PLYADTEFLYAVIDEAQYIKNPETKNARAVKTLKAKRRFALTGTPVENSLAELWSIFDFLMPGYLFTYPKFRDTLETEVVRGNEEAAQRLSRRIKPFILRRLKTDVLKELPPKTETDVLCPLIGEQRDLYAANLATVRESLTNAGERINKVAMLALLTKLRQICCEPTLAYAAYNGNSSKRDACLDLVRSATAAGHKVLVFSQFTSMLEILRTHLVQEGITHFLLQGDTPKVERVKLVSRFNADDTQVFLISLKAGGTGLNLTGADVVIHYDPWWNESVMRQATDRAYRIGQDKPVQVYKLITKDSIEERIVELQQKKSALSGIVMNAAAAQLRPEDILALLD
ncbi:MAG: DEAD/DEAH box helicase, partial [Clostridiales bacterium]|nr:DEAD/DEAH box helicase [Clostridiales bacterium]